MKIVRKQSIKKKVIEFNHVKVVDEETILMLKSLHTVVQLGGYLGGCASQVFSYSFSSSHMLTIFIATRSKKLNFLYAYEWYGHRKGYNYDEVLNMSHTYELYKNKIVDVTGILISPNIWVLLLHSTVNPSTPAWVSLPYISVSKS